MSYFYVPVRGFFLVLTEQGGSVVASVTKKTGLPILFCDEELVLASFRFVSQRTISLGFIGLMFDVFEIKISRTPLPLSNA